jgi:hypothetical protein
VPACGSPPELPVSLSGEVPVSGEDLGCWLGGWIGAGCPVFLAPPPEWDALPDDVPPVLPLPDATLPARALTVRPGKAFAATAVRAPVRAALATSKTRFDWVSRRRAASRLHGVCLSGRSWRGVDMARAQISFRVAGMDQLCLAALTPL